MNYRSLLLTGVLFFGMTLTAAAEKEIKNKIEKVFVVDYMTVEVVMDEPLTAEETDPLRISSPDFKPDFTFNEDVRMIGMPIPQESDGFHENTYRIPVSGLDEGIIYQISYKGQKGKTFKAYSPQEMKDKYRDRYGSYF